MRCCSKTYFPNKIRTPRSDEPSERGFVCFIKAGKACRQKAKLFREKEKRLRFCQKYATIQSGMIYAQKGREKAHENQA